MATTAMSDRPAATLEPRETSGEPSVQTIIAAARKPQPAPARGAWLCAGASSLLWYLSYFPMNWGPLAFLAMVPLLLLVRVEQRPRRMYLATYVTWAIGSLAVTSWMAANLPMVAAWIALSLYMAAYAPVFLLASRVAVHRLSIPLVIAVPVIWTGLEFMRAHLMTGFPWYLIGHTQWRWTTLIQISDLVGVYGVSFVVMGCAAAVALCVPAIAFEKLKLLPRRDGMVVAVPLASLRARVVAMSFALVGLLAALGYGMVRLSGDHFTPGPRVALIQGNFPSRLYPTASQGEVWDRHYRMTAMAVPYQPDFIVWPESAYRWPLFDTAEGVSDEQLDSIAGRLTRGNMTAEDWRDASASVKEILGDVSTQANAAFIAGMSAYTADAKQGLKRYNSAAFVVPELGLAGRYDKRHLVAFGEYIPLRNVFPFLQALSPYTEGFSVDHGASAQVFRHAGYNVSPLICYEDTVSELVRNVVAASEGDPEREIDVLVNVTNDGWFDNSAEQEQHLVTSLFRAVETRTPLARSANTGVSAVIDGNGRIVEPIAFLDGETKQPIPLTERSGRFKKDLNAVLVADVPLDSRSSLYVRGGDWFAGFCGAAALFCLGWTIVPRRK